MIEALFQLLGGWKQVRAYAGFSYQMSRKGKRRIVPIEGYRNRGLPDNEWIETGKFADDRLIAGYGGYIYNPTKKPAKRTRLAKVDFALNR